jgi:mRNA interferase MazF
MVEQKHALRGEIWLCALDPTIGSEIQKTRPCLIVSPDSMNLRIRRYTVMPLTSGSQQAKFRVAVNFKSRDGFLLADQLRTIDQLRLKKCVGVLDSDSLTRALLVLRKMFEE